MRNSSLDLCEGVCEDLSHVRRVQEGDVRVEAFFLKKLPKRFPRKRGGQVTVQLDLGKLLDFL